MDARKQRFRLGLFVAGAAVLLTGMILIFGGAPQRFFASADTYTIVFDDAPGVSPGTPVRKSGVRIGEVSSVKLNDATGKVAVVIRVNKQFTIRQHEEPVISQDLLSRDTTIDFVPVAPPLSRPKTAPDSATPGEPSLKPPEPVPSGEPKLKPPEPIPSQEPKLEPPVPLKPDSELKPKPPAAIQPASWTEQTPPPPGGADPNNPLGNPVPPGSIIQGRPAADTRAFLSQASDILPTVQRTLNSIRRSVENFEQMTPQLELGIREFAGLGRAIREAVPEIRRTNDEIRGILQNVRTFAPNIRKTNDELQLTLRNFSNLGESINVLVQTNQDRFVKTLDQSNDVLQRISQVLSDENQKNFTAIMRATQAASANFDGVIRNADELLKESQRTAKRLQDSMNVLDSALTNINAATKPLAERGERVLRNLDGSIDQLNRILSSIGESVASGRDGTVQRLFRDPSLYNNLNDAACMITRVIPRIDRILRDIEVFADKVARHPESIGVGGAIRPNAGLKESPTLSQPQPYRQRP